MKHKWFIAIIVLLATLVIALYFIDKKLPMLLAKDLPAADSVLVKKAERKLYLVRDGLTYRAYNIALGGNPEGHKQQEGDQRTPEGRYLLDWRNIKSAYHRSLHVSYPNSKDRTQAAAMSVPPGGMIMIHGQPNGLGWLSPLLQLWDWTDGCIAVSNVEIEEIWRAVGNGTPILIEP
ncbi:L,D-transpeptidase family protein [Marinobacter sp. 1-4A]|uniref:L,D-transpeptidase family protein n=1 Tax=Marinobacter sp. 1-4A TaxID=2582919 RepID=UPI001903C8DA|nr:L,D-transpeptidase family protein [Marinobacter sp. 1-4A]MBK1852024.1 L,D-transpeptidase family protein [Marinobacter sp. 1-4A]